MIQSLDAAGKLEILYGEKPDKLSRPTQAEVTAHF
jgi:hypothetical protein